MHNLMGFPKRNDDPVNLVMGDGQLHDGEFEKGTTLGSCTSLKDDKASVQRVEGKHLTFTLVRRGCDIHLTANCLPDSNFRSQQTINLEWYYG